MALIQQTLQNLNNVQFGWLIAIFRNSEGEKEIWFRSNDIAAFLQNDTSRKDRDIKYFPNKWTQTWSEIKQKLERQSSQVFPTWNPQTIFINKLGLFRFMIYSKHPRIECFRKWISNKLIPYLNSIDLPVFYSENIPLKELDPLEGTSIQYAVMTELERTEWLNSFRYKERKSQ